MSKFICQERNEEAPRIGCGCRECYRAREAALDPRLLALARGRHSLCVAPPSHFLVGHHITAYLTGRVDYGALQVGIIRALMELSNQQYETTATFVSLSAKPPFIVADKDIKRE